MCLIVNQKIKIKILCVAKSIQLFHFELLHLNPLNAHILSSQMKGISQTVIGFLSCLKSSKRLFNRMKRSSNRLMKHHERFECLIYFNLNRKCFSSTKYSFSFRLQSSSLYTKSIFQMKTFQHAPDVA